MDRTVRELDLGEARETMGVTRGDLGWEGDPPAGAVAIDREERAQRTRPRRVSMVVGELPWKRQAGAAG